MANTMPTPSPAANTSLSFNKRKIQATLMVILLAVCLNVVAQAKSADEEKVESENGFVSALLNGQFKALLRYNGMYRNSNLHVLQDGSGTIPSDEKNQYYSALGGFVGYETGAWMNTSIGATVYTSQPFGNNPADRRGLGGLYEASGDQEGYTALGEFFMRWQNEDQRLTAGRQEMPGYRMVSLSNVRMTPITHSGIAYDNTVLDGLKFSTAYIREMKERNERDFVDMATGARLKESSNGKQWVRGDYNPDNYDDSDYIGKKKAMFMAGAIYQGDEYSLEAWNYRVDDFVSSFYLFGDYSFQAEGGSFNYTLSGQYTAQSDIGSHIGGNIDTWQWGLRLFASNELLSWFVGYNQVAYNEDSYDGGTLFLRWGTPQMFNSFQVQDSELAGTRSYGAGLQYDFGLNGLVRGLVMRWRYAYYDLPDELYMTDARQDRSEATLDVRYSLSRDSDFGIFTPMKGLSLQLRLAWNDYRTDYDFEAYKAIHGYDFETVTSNFIDARLYLDYVF